MIINAFGQAEPLCQPEHGLTIPLPPRGFRTLVAVEREIDGRRRARRSGKTATGDASHGRYAIRV
jgi:hypothetical protein